MNSNWLWALACAALWTAGMLYFDWQKRKKNKNN